MSQDLSVEEVCFQECGADCIYWRQLSLFVA